MHLFFSPDISSDNNILPPGESHHAICVLRLKKDNIIHIVDGKGGFYKAEIINSDAKACKVKILETRAGFEKRNYHIHLAVAPTKNIERYEWFLEKATEIGVDEITPLICKHSGRRKVKTERLKKVLVSGMKQSLKAYLPKLNSIVTLPDFISTHKNQNGQKFIAQPGKDAAHFKSKYRKGSDATVLVGPEGDFSEEEVRQALEEGFEMVNLGNSRLRTETAAIVICHAISILND